MADNPTVQHEHKSVTERYYTPKFILDSANNVGEDLCILTHSNRICVITIAKSHPLIKDEKKIENVNFEVEKGVNRLENRVSGKGKRGAQLLNPTSAICHVKCTDGEIYTIHCGIKAQLIEVNENLVQKPELLTIKPQSEGYVAIVLPKLKEYDQVTKKLKTLEEYEKRRQSLNNT